MNILFTCAGRRNYLINYFKTALNGKGKVFTADMQASAPAMVDSDKAFIVPPIYEDNYINSLKEICLVNNIVAIISLNDLELPILTKEIKMFKGIGTKIIISSPRVIDICFDKWKTCSFLSSIKLNFPRTYISYNKAIEAVKKSELTFPLIIKPRWGSASIGIEEVDNIDGLFYSYELLLLKIKKSMLSKASSEDYEHSILIQEKLIGIEYGIDIINNLNGDYQTTIVKKKLAMRAGETDKAITQFNDELSSIGSKIGTNLKHIGNLDCDVFYNGKTYTILELNPRFGGGYPFSHLAGVNLPAAMIKWLDGKVNVREFLQYEEGMAFSKYDKLMKVPYNL